MSKTTTVDAVLRELEDADEPAPTCPLIIAGCCRGDFDALDDPDMLIVSKRNLRLILERYLR